MPRYKDQRRWRVEESPPPPYAGIPRSLLALYMDKMDPQSQDAIYERLMNNITGVSNLQVVCS